MVGTLLVFMLKRYNKINLSKEWTEKNIAVIKKTIEKT